MADKQDGLTFFDKVFHDVHQIVNFLRCQYSRWLIKDQDVVVTVQHLEDLSTLLHADGNVGNQSIRVNLHAVLFTESKYFLSCIVGLQDAMFGILHTENNVLQYRKALHKFEVLMDHADAKTIGIGRIVNLDNLSIFFDGTLFSLIKSKQNRHQG